MQFDDNCIQESWKPKSVSNNNTVVTYFLGIMLTLVY